MTEQQSIAPQVKKVFVSMLAEKLYKTQVGTAMMLAAIALVVLAENMRELKLSSGAAMFLLVGMIAWFWISYFIMKYRIENGTFLSQKGDVLETLEYIEKTAKKKPCP